MTVKSVYARRIENFTNLTGSITSELSGDRRSYVIKVDVEKAMIELLKDQKVAGEQILNVPQAQLLDGLMFVTNFVRKEMLEDAGL